MDIYAKLKVLKPKLAEEGFVIDGIVGSYARGDYTAQSDVDILYHIEKHFLKQYGGFTAMIRIDEIRKMISSLLHKEIDLIATRAMSETAKKYMLPDRVDV